MKTLLTVAVLLASVSSFAMEAGKYERKQPSGDTDIMTVAAKYKYIQIEETRQVGRTEDAAADDVPYPTVCRYKQFGEITSEDADSISYKVNSVILTARVKASHTSQLENDVNCNTFVNIQNGNAMDEGLSYTVQKKGFQKK